jgi:hypothetical protein
MGSNFATELANGVFPDLTLELQIQMHLTGNHYPPVPLSMVKPCIEAIDAYWEGNSNTMIELPEGVSWRNTNRAPAWSIIDGHHLEPWVNDWDNEEEGE